ncbi:hypothetical protein V8C44DRAFT_317732 [Trichoderma aethiopicum]
MRKNRRLFVTGIVLFAPVGVSQDAAVRVTRPGRSRGKKSRASLLDNGGDGDDDDDERDGVARQEGLGSNSSQALSVLLAVDLDAGRL